MEKDLYKIMQNLKEAKSSANTKDIMYIGTIQADDKTPNGKVTVSKDVFLMLDIAPDGKVTKKYYDENQTLLAGRGANGELYPNRESMNDDLDFLSDIDALDEEQGISLEELDKELDEVSKALNIDRKDILAMSEVELDQMVDTEGNPTLTLSDDSNGLDEETTKKQNEIVLENLDIKQEIALDPKVDSKHSLGEILGVPAGSKLIAIDSDDIKDNDNSTRYSCLIKTPDGKIESLKQIGGKDSDKKIYETNRDGSRVESKTVQSSFAIDSPLVEGGIITVRAGQMGTLEVGYGQMDRTSHRDAFTQRLEARDMYPVTSRVREEFNTEKGLDNVPEKIDEIKSHKEHGCKKMTLDEADGNLDTGHIHGEQAVELILSDDNVRDIIDDTYTHDEIAERFETIMKDNPSKSVKEILDKTKADLVLDAERLYDRDHKH